MNTFPLPKWPRAFGGPAGRGRIKDSPGDFQVEEILGFEPSGAGEHVFLWVEKRGLNTEEVAERLAAFAKIPRQRVSYAGLKDRHAVTRQWFGLHLPGKGELPWLACQGEGYRVLSWTRNRRRLRKGALAGNRFRVRIRQLSADAAALQDLLRRIRREGLPNYFGTQRFGHQGTNLVHARALLAGERIIRNRHLRGLYLSAARALIFNQVLAFRVERQNWNRALPGDLLMFNRGNSFFSVGDPDQTIERRVAALEIHPSGPLWGKGIRATAEAGIIEQQAARRWEGLARSLERQAKALRRPLRIRVSGLVWQLAPASLTLEFSLPAGSYATVLIDELIDLEEE